MAVARTTSGRQAPPSANHDDRSDGTLDALLDALTAARDGDFSVRLPTGGADGRFGEIAAAYNELAERNAGLDAELARIGKVVGRDGVLDERVSLGGAGGSWERSIDAINALVDDLVRPTTEVARVIDAVAEGDCRRRWR